MRLEPGWWIFDQRSVWAVQRSLISHLFHHTFDDRMVRNMVVKLDQYRTHPLRAQLHVRPALGVIAEMIHEQIGREGLDFRDACFHRD